MSAAIGGFMLVLLVVLGAAKAWSEGHLESMLKGLIWGCLTGAWLGTATYLISRGAA